MDGHQVPGTNLKMSLLVLVLIQRFSAARYCSACRTARCEIQGDLVGLPFFPKPKKTWIIRVDGRNFQTTNLGCIKPNEKPGISTTSTAVLVRFLNHQTVARAKKGWLNCKLFPSTKVEDRNCCFGNEKFRNRISEICLTKMALVSWICGNSNIFLHFHRKKPWGKDDPHFDEPAYVSKMGWWKTTN